MKKDRARRAQRGQGLVELILVIPALVILMAVAISLAPLAHVKFVADQAAYDCAISAAQTLDMGRGALQGRIAAVRTLQASHMMERAWIDVRGDWSREGLVICTISITPPDSGFTIFTPPHTIRATYALPVQRNKSEWRP